MIISRALAVASGLLLPMIAQAQSLNIDLGAAGEAGATGRLVQLTALVTVLSVAPSLLVMVTAFTRIVIVLSLLRTALSTQGTPPNMVLIGLALFLTFFVMQPVLSDAWTTGILPLTEGRVGELEGLAEGRGVSKKRRPFARGCPAEHRPGLAGKAKQGSGL